MLDDSRMTQVTSLTPLLAYFLMMEVLCCPPGWEGTKLDAFPPPTVILPSSIFSLITRNSSFLWFRQRLAYQNKLHCHGFMSDQDVPKERQRQQTIINSAYRAVSLHPLLSRLCRRKYLSHSFWAWQGHNLCIWTCRELEVLWPHWGETWWPTGVQGLDHTAGI